MILSHTQQGAIPHVLEPPPQDRLIYLEQFVDLLQENTMNVQLKAFLNTRDKLYLATVDVQRLKKPKWPKGGRQALGVAMNGSQHMQLQAQDFKRAVNMLQPDVAFLMDCSESLYFGGTETRSSCQKRRKRWLEYCKNAIDCEPPVWISVGDELDPSERSITAKLIVQMFPQASGYVMVLPIESNPTKEVSDLWKQRLEASLEHLEDKPKAVFGIESLEHIAYAKTRGITYFDNQWLETLSMEGVALLVSEAPDLASGVKTVNDHEHYLDLKHQIFVKDFGPLLKGCECFACKNHTRAYINHLLKVQDMLAHVLLQHHNVYQFQNWESSL